jgi:hypothetical protein
MKAILIFPPQWTPLNPHFSLASLYSQLVDNGYKVNLRDLNIEFYDEILKKEHLKVCLDNSLKNFDVFLKNCPKILISIKKMVYIQKSLKRNWLDTQK